ncbi:MAG: hypothetical protein AAFW73_20790 [Bacteroidota bacterium]
MKKLFTLGFFLGLLLPLSTAQYQGRNGGTAIAVNFNYAVQFPGGDLIELYGTNFRVGGGIDLLTRKRFILGIDGGLMFGNTLKEDVLSTLRTPEGGIIGNNKVYADIVLKQRGFQVSGHLGKVFAISAADKARRSGIRATIGAGLLQHRVRIQDDFNSSVPQLDEQYKKGYDRLTNGLMIQEFIGYQLLSNNRLVNFYVGFEFSQGFTQNRRNFDFKLRRAVDESRFDSLVGFRVNWILPFYIDEDPDAIEYY